MGDTALQMMEEFRKTQYKDKWEVRTGVNQQFPAPKDAKYLNDLAKIGAFLSDKENDHFCSALEMLEDAIVAEYEKRSGSVVTRSKNFPKSFTDFSQERQIQHTAHLLTTVLAQKEKEEGFLGIADNNCVSFYGNLPSDEFGGAIRSRHLAKDYVGLDHGAYTHRIQWYLATVKKRELGIQSTNMSTIFKSSGRVWGNVFDRNASDGVTLLRDDFRRPEYLNPWLSKNNKFGNNSWPVLSAFLKSRNDRLSNRGWAPDILKINLAKKLWPDQCKPPPNYRKATAKENGSVLESFKLSQEQMTQLDRCHKGVSFDSESKTIVSFSNAKKKPWVI